MWLEIAILWEDGMWNTEFHKVDVADENQAEAEAAKIFKGLSEQPSYRKAVAHVLFGVNDHEGAGQY